MKDYVNGLYVKDGRLINDRPTGITGIQEAAMIRKAAKRARKVEDIADGVTMANSMDEISSIMGKKIF